MVSALVNPQLPDNRDPNYFKFSDSISQPKADESTGIALKTVGQGIEGGVELADTAVKDVIKSDVWQRVDAEREKFNTALANAATYGNAAGPQPAGADPANDTTVGFVQGNPPPPVDLLNDKKVNVPAGIQSGISDVARNQAALEQNKITKREYYKNLDTLTKDMRSYYPAGYRQYIDTEVSKITGVNPANALMDSYIDAINTSMTSAQKEQNFWRSKIVDSGYPEADKILAQYERTGDHNKVSQWLAYNNGIRSNLALQKAAYEANNQSKELRTKNGEEYASSAAGHAATTFFYNSQKFANGDMSAADIADKMADLSLHPEKANDVAYQGLAERYAALHTQAYNQTMALLTRPQKTADGTFAPPVSDTIGMSKTKQIVEDSVGALFNKTREFIADKQFSPAYSLQNSAAANQNNALFKIFQDPTIGGKVLTASALNKAAPNLTPVITGKLLGEDLDKDLGDFVSEQGKQAIAQTGGKYYGVDGKIYSFRQSMEELKQAEAQGTNVPMNAYKNLLEVRRAITDPTASPESVHNTVKYLYDPVVNKGNMSKFMDDYYDPAKGGMVRGRSSAFSTLTEPDVTKSIWTKGTPTDWQKYSTWAKREFATQFGEQVRTMDVSLKNAFEEGQKYATTGTPYNGPKVTWNTETKQFDIRRRDGSSYEGLGGLDINYRTVQNLNAGLRNMAILAKQEGTNVDAYLFKVLKDNGFSPTRDVEGIPAQIMRSMITGNGYQMKERGPAAPSRSNFTPEGPTGALDEFISNPVGNVSPTAKASPRPSKRGNLSDEQIISIQTDEIPEGMSPAEFLKILQRKK